MRPHTHLSNEGKKGESIEEIENGNCAFQEVLTSYKCKNGFDQKDNADLANAGATANPIEIGMIVFIRWLPTCASDVWKSEFSGTVSGWILWNALL